MGDGSATHCWSINYLHMNRFFTYKLWTMDWTKDYDYFMRLVRVCQEL